MKGRGLSIFRAFSGACKLEVEIDREYLSAAQAVYDEFHNAEIEIIIKKYHNQRSLAANAYCWKLINELSAKLKIPAVEIYQEQIKNIGGNSVIVPIKDEAVETWVRNWNERGIGWVTDKLESKLEGYTNIVCYYGSSTYDAMQMSRLISLVVDECKENGIETKTPSELALLMSDWGK